jgi:hypothetical protein
MGQTIFSGAGAASGMAIDFLQPPPTEMVPLGDKLGEGRSRKRSGGHQRI